MDALSTLEKSYENKVKELRNLSHVSKQVLSYFRLEKKISPLLYAYTRTLAYEDEKTEKMRERERERKVTNDEDRDRERDTVIEHRER